MILKILAQYDGCPGKQLTIPFPESELQPLLKYFVKKKKWNIDNLMVVDATTGRAISFVYEG